MSFRTLYTHSTCCMVGSICQTRPTFGRSIVYSKAWAFGPSRRAGYGRYSMTPIADLRASFRALVNDVGEELHTVLGCDELWSIASQMWFGHEIWFGHDPDR